MNSIQNIIEFFFTRKWLGILLVAGLALGIGISTFYRGAISPKQRTDLTVFLKAGEMIATGRANHIYGIENARHWHYVYPPALAILLAPVSRWPLSVTVTLAYFLSLACLAATIILSRRFSGSTQAAKTGRQGHASVPGSLGSWPERWQIALAMILSLPMVLNTLTRGQFGVIMLFFQAAVFYAFLKRRKALAGLLLAFAVSLKISPLAFLVFFFLMKREWKILASAALGFFLFLFLFPSLAIGFHQNLELLKIWHGLMSISQSDTAYQNYLWSELFTPFSEDNQSLYAIVTRLVWGTETRLIGHSNILVRVLTSFAGLALLALPFTKTRGHQDTTEDPVRSLAEFSLFPMLMLFTSPVTQIHHYTAIYFLFLAALRLMDRYPHGSWTRRYLVLSLWACAFSLTFGMTFKAGGLLGIPLWGSMLLWFAVLFSSQTKKITS